MEKYITWYVLQLKAWCKKPVCWLSLVGMLLLTVLVQNISLPKGDNTIIGIYNADSAYVQETIEQLQQKKSVFQFQSYNDPEILEHDVVAGKVECGFIFEKGFEQNWKSGTYANTITYISTPLTTKGYVAQETIFATLLQKFSGTIMDQNISKVFAAPDDETRSYLQERNEDYLQSNVTFSIDTLFVEQDATIAEENEKAKNLTFPVQGIIGIIIFITMLMNGANRFSNQDQKVTCALDVRNQRIFDFTNNIATVTLEAVFGFVIILVMKSNRGFLIELIALLVLITVSALWVLLFGRFLRNEITFLSSITAIIVVNLMITPIFVNLAQYVPVLRYISCFFPVGIYLFF